MTLQQTLEAQLQQLGARRARPQEFPQVARWGQKYLAYTSLSKNPNLFIFLGSAGAVRTGSSPAFSSSAPILRQKLLDRAEAQAKAAKAQEVAARKSSPPGILRKTFTIEDFQA